MQTVNQTELRQEEKQALAAEYARLVKHIALRMSAQLPAHIEVDDLIQDGVIGLMDALNRFDPSKRIKFQTFATTRIHGAMLDALRSMDWASRGGPPTRSRTTPGQRAAAPKAWPAAQQSGSVGIYWSELG